MDEVDAGGQTDSAQRPAAESGPAPGAQLREAREARGLSVDEVAVSLCLTTAQIRALEADDYGKFPAPVFVSGFVRKYAMLVELDPAPLLAYLERAGLKTPPIQSELTASIPMPRRYGVPAEMRIAAAVVAGVAVLAGLWYLTRPAPVDDPAPAADIPAVVDPAIVRPEPERPPVRDQAGAVPEPPPADQAKQPVPGEEEVAPVEGPMDELVLRFSGSSWVEIVDVTGRRLAYRMGEAGDVLRLRGLAPFDILLGNAPSVAIDYNGEPYRDFPVSRQNVASFTLGRPGNEQ